jgi:hypothetical protein
MDIRGVKSRVAVVYTPAVSIAVWACLEVLVRKMWLQLILGNSVDDLNLNL